MVIKPSTCLWLVWLRTSLCATRLCVGRGTSVPLMETIQLPCVTRRRRWKRSPTKCSQILIKTRLTLDSTTMDGSKRPKVFPTRVPQLLLNGTMGIAVGMATNIPPHNLTEVMNALEALCERPRNRHRWTHGIHQGQTSQLDLLFTTQQRSKRCTPLVVEVSRFVHVLKSKK